MAQMSDPAFAPDSCHDVAIVGLGPVGATLANLLSLRGLTVLVLEREADIYGLPRAVHFDGEVMRVFQTLGLADTLLPDLIVSPGMKFVNASGQVLIDWSRPQDPGPQGWHVSYRFHQPTLEYALRERLAAQPKAIVRLSHEVVAIRQVADRIDLHVKDRRGADLLKTSARYVVGCDGARSLVRQAMGSGLDDLQSHERWLVLDVLLKRDRPDLGDHSIQYCDPKRPATYVRGVGRRRRWELMLMPGDDPATITRPESVWPLLSRWITPADAELERPAVYTFHSVVATGWRDQRLLIAGDAAHQTPPFMGQGMCAGIRDAYNLAWKLADVVKGDASSVLLDSYESERSPHVRTFIEAAVELGGVIQATDPARVAQRDAQMVANPQVFRTPQPLLGPGVYQPGAHAGRLVAQPSLADGQRLDDRLGYRFALIGDPALVRAATPCDRLAVMAATEPALQRWLAGFAARVVLLRPDRHLAGVASDVGLMQALITRYVAGVAS